MSHLIGSQQLPQSMATQPQTVASNQGSGPPVPSSVAHGYGIPPQNTPSAQTGQQSNQEQKYDLITKVRHLVLSLKESLAVSMSSSLFRNQASSTFRTFSQQWP